MKLNKLGKLIFGGIESFGLALTLLGSFKLYILSIIGLIILVINSKFLSDHI